VAFQFASCLIDACLVLLLLLQNVPVERLCEIAEALAKNTHLQKLHLANTRSTDKVANVRITIASYSFALFCISEQYLVI